MTDVWQPVRMMVIWPVMVGCVAFYAVRFIASALDGQLTRWQASLAGVVGVMAAIVTRSIARSWDGGDLYWVAFTVGLAFAALVLLANALGMIVQAEARRES